jgi:hypothetical protein
MSEAITLALLSHERLVKGARSVMKETTQIIRERRMAAFHPQLFATVLTVDSVSGPRLSFSERILHPLLITLDSTESHAVAAQIHTAATERAFACCFYLAGGSADGKELQVIGLNLDRQKYALARPARYKKGLGVIPSGRIRPIEGEAPPFLQDVVRHYRHLIRERYKGDLP